MRAQEKARKARLTTESSTSPRRPRDPLAWAAERGSAPCPRSRSACRVALCRAPDHVARRVPKTWDRPEFVPSARSAPAGRAVAHEAGEVQRPELPLLFPASRAVARGAPDLVARPNRHGAHHEAGGAAFPPLVEFTPGAAKGEKGGRPGTSRLRAAGVPLDSEVCGHRPGEVRRLRREGHGPCVRPWVRRRVCPMRVGRCGKLVLMDWPLRVSNWMVEPNRRSPEETLGTNFCRGLGRAKYSPGRRRLSTANGYPSRTCRTLRAMPSMLKGFWRNGAPASMTPWCAIRAFV